MVGGVINPRVVRPPLLFTRRSWLPDAKALGREAPIGRIGGAVLADVGPGARHSA